VRLLAVESCGAFGQALSQEDCRTSLLPVVLRFSQVGRRGVRDPVQQQQHGLQFQLMHRMSSARGYCIAHTVPLAAAIRLIRLCADTFPHAGA
jgi:hypothetical protein